MSAINEAIREYFARIGLDLDDEQINELADINARYAAAGCPGFAEHLAYLLGGWHAEESLRNLALTISPGPAEARESEGE